LIFFFDWQRRKESLERLEEQEELSIEQQMAQQYKAFEAVQRANEAREAAQRAKLEEQEDLSIEQQMAQQVLFAPNTKTSHRTFKTTH